MWENGREEKNNEMCKRISVCVCLWVCEFGCLCSLFSYSIWWLCMSVCAGALMCAWVSEYASNIFILTSSEKFSANTQNMSSFFYSSFSSLSTSCCVCCRWNWLFLQFEFFFHVLSSHSILSAQKPFQLAQYSFVYFELKWKQKSFISFTCLVKWSTSDSKSIENRTTLLCVCRVACTLYRSLAWQLASVYRCVCVYFPWISCVACSDVTIEIILWYNGDQISNFILLKWQMFVIGWASTSSSPSSPFLCAAHQYTHSHTQYKRTLIDCTAAEIISHSHQCKTQSTHSLFRFTHFTLTYLPHKRVETCIDTHAHIRICAVSGIQTHEYSNKSTNTTKKQQQQKHNMNDAYQFKDANHFQRIN